MLKRLKFLILLFCFLVHYERLTALSLNDSINPGITANAIVLNVTTTNPTCGRNNGIINIHASSGVAPYSYSITGFLPDADGYFSHLAPGTFSIMVTDASGQTTSSSVTLVNIFSPPTASAVISSHPTGCNTRDASITLTASGGLPPYVYSIGEMQFQTDNFFPSLTAGSYYYAVKDANGCESPNNVFNNLTIPEECPIHENGVTTSYSCNPFKTYLGLINVSGGTAPYMYSLDGIVYQSSESWSNGVPAGIYTIWVKDATGLILLYTVAVTEKCSPILSLSSVVQPANCGLNGIITVTASGGISPYQYSIDGINYQTNNQFTGLASGNYTITVKDANSLVSSIYIIVTKGCLTVNASAINSTCGNSNGSVFVQASGGTSPYLYSIDGINYVTNNNFINLVAGNYAVYAKDATGGIGTAQVAIANINGPAITSVVTTPTECVTHTGTIMMTCQGGTFPLLYSLDGTLFNSNHFFTGLDTGEYNIIVKDSNGCTDTSTGVITLNNNITVDAGNALSLCEGSNVTLNGSSDAQQFSWIPATNLNDPNSLHPIATPTVSTMYYLTASSGACNKTDSVYLSVSPAPVANAGDGVIICFGQNITLHGSGGISCIWRPITNLNDATSFDPLVIKPLTSIIYKLIVTDAKGCSSLNNSSVTITVTPPPEVFAGNDTSVVINDPLHLNASDVNGSGFNSYMWFPSTGLNNPSIQSPISTLNKSTTYTVIALTPVGCEGRDTINITVFEKSEIYVPNAFTPNGDGKNDILKAIPIGIKIFKYFTVYDRFGNKIFSTTNPNIGWKGNTKNEFNSSNVFVWIAAGVDYLNHELIRRGTVVLIR